MIDYLKGRITAKNKDSLVVETGGIGIRVTATQAAVDNVKRDEDCTILTYLHIQENKWEIYGFKDREEREAFLVLISIRGVGPRAAMSILNWLTPADLKEIAAEKQGSARLQQVGGIGRKTAERIAVELKDKLDKMAGWKSKGGKTAPPDQQEEIVKALQNLGYKPRETQAAIQEMPSLPETLPEAVREVLRYMGKNR